jgi:DNA-binding NarL/FixJ family response regulator
MTVAKRGGVLLVDDEPEVLDGLCLTLRGFSCRLVLAQSGRQALDVLERHDIALIVSDEHMPGMSGSDLLQRVARERPWIGRVMLTGRPNLELAVRSINMGKVARFLRKPCPPADLRAAISDVLEGVAATRASIQSRAMACERFDLSDSSSMSDDPIERRPTTRPPVAWLDPADLARLSARERDVLAQLVDGRRTIQIAKALFISPHTVRNHLKSIFRKLKIHSQVELLERRVAR